MHEFDLYIELNFLKSSRNQLHILTYHLAQRKHMENIIHRNIAFLICTNNFSVSIQRQERSWHDPRSGSPLDTRYSACMGEELDFPIPTVRPKNLPHMTFT